MLIISIRTKIQMEWRRRERERRAFVQRWFSISACWWKCWIRYDFAVDATEHYFFLIASNHEYMRSEREQVYWGQTHKRPIFFYGHNIFSDWLKKKKSASYFAFSFIQYKCSYSLFIISIFVHRKMPRFPAIFVRIGTNIVHCSVLIENNFERNRKKRRWK